MCLFADIALNYSLSGAKTLDENSFAAYSIAFKTTFPLLYHQRTIWSLQKVFPLG